MNYEHYTCDLFVEVIETVLTQFLVLIGECLRIGNFYKYRSDERDFTIKKPPFLGH